MDDRQCVWYSVVLTKLPVSVNHNTIRPQVQVSDDDGILQYRADGTPLTVYVEEVDMSKIMTFLVYRWSTKQNDMDVLRRDKRVLYFTNALKNVLNNNPVCISWHDGDRDTNCQFTGYHLHIMIGITVKGPLCDKYDYKRLKATCSEIGVEIRNQKLLYPDNFLSYLVKQPRKSAGTNSTYLKTKHQEMDVDEVSQPVTKKARVDKPSKQSSCIMTLKALMNKYKTSDKYELIKAANDCGNATDEQLLRSMIRNPNWKKMYTVAIEELDIDNRLRNKSYYQLFMEFPKTIPGRRTLSYKDTQRCFLEWCEEQVIDPMRYLISAYLVLAMKLPKKNTLYLCGKSNAGKTYMTNALLPFTHMIGSHITSREFAFQECLSKPVILISELTITTQEQAELYKQVFAGEAIFVNVKNRHAEIMNRKPVILTTNYPVWKNVPSEIEGLRNRCFIFNHLTTSNVVSRFASNGAASHHYFQHMFRLIDIHASTMNIKPEDMLNESTMNELRPIAMASETDTDPVDLFPQASQNTEVDSTDDYIIITDSETENTEDLEAYNVETDVDLITLKTVQTYGPTSLDFK